MKFNQIYFVIISAFWVVLTVIILLGTMKLALKVMFVLSAVLFIYESYQSLRKEKGTERRCSIFNFKS